MLRKSWILNFLLLGIFSFLASCSSFKEDESSNHDDDPFISDADSYPSPSETESSFDDDNVTDVENDDNINEDEDIDIDNKEEEVKLTADEKIDQGTIFKANQVIDYYNVPVLIIRISTAQKNVGAVENNVVVSEDSDTISDDDASEDIPSKEELARLKDIQAQIDLVSSHLDTFHTPFYYLDKDLEIQLDPKHKDEVDLFLQRAEADKTYIILMYVKGHKIKTWEASTANIEKTIYTQYITSHILSQASNIRVEKRYMEEIPEDEVLMIMVEYSGSIPTNIYNAPKGNTLRWLEQFRELEHQRLEESRLRRTELDALISTAGRIKPDEPEAPEEN